jgi:hypothetical protein
MFQTPPQLTLALAPTLLFRRTQRESADLEFFELDSVIEIFGGDVFFMLYPSQA